MQKIVKVSKNIKIGGREPLVLIAGPCVIESEKSALYHAEAIRDLTSRYKVPFIFKSSYDKANRTSVSSFRGPGLKKGLEILSKVKKEFGIPVLSDVHCSEEIGEAASVLDIIQIPALLCRQTDLIVKAARTNRIINIKKGQFISPYDMKNAIEKIESTGNKKILVTERGTLFGYNNLVSDFRSIVIMKDFGYPVIYDASHSVQMPGALGDKSGGMREFMPPLIAAAASVGCDGIFVEVHTNPAQALCDGPNMLSLKTLGSVILLIKEAQKVGRHFR
ncbi:MAG: 3-deoxy-8-phosphooctulonate synthase [Candidatus Omnitrophica bacterium CG07_land_8_20_14_0_80_42_15]|uniref:2-dehydro-3-deoxyphosphooctonate aldolase n=1 Tax=Candidatus Aquitaenariimonas noxiae TaxID=1974741 RepID=A0A2J0KW38_9BACT|nr:MAG: 3-deoxy-8-phosphooctulonate synthase [Candidatus Omnitrophica bacterium CG07_land_8_20_14_0_80_42_15]